MPLPLPSIRVLLRGGLGNQLFQYGAGMALSLRNDMPLLLDSVLLPNKPETIDGVTRWPSQINEFFHHGSFVGRENQSGLKSLIVQSALQVDRFLGDKAPAVLSRFGRFSNETRAEFDYFETLGSKRIVINSYCNSPKYFLGFEDEIRASIRDLCSPSPLLNQLRSLAAKHRPLAVHVRLGDYKNLSRVYGEADPGYISRAIELQFRLSGKRDIWLFSDEPEAARVLLGQYFNRVVTPPEVDALTPLETLMIMSSCRGLVGANSTFSWWAAYLNKDEESVHIFPRPYFALGGPPEPKAWLEENWIQLGRQT